MSKLRALVLLLALSFSLSGCSYSTYYVAVDQAVYPATIPRQVAISTQKQLHSNHKKIGRVAVTTWGGGEEARAALQREASRIGANAVVDFQLERGMFQTAASGLAVLIYQ